MVLEIKEKIAEVDNGIKPSLAATYNCIGVVYGKRGDIDKELKYYMKALAIREKSLGKNHPSTKLTYKNIMTTYERLGNEENANLYKEKAGL